MNNIMNIYSFTKCTLLACYVPGAVRDCMYTERKSKHTINSACPLCCFQSIGMTAFYTNCWHIGVMFISVGRRVKECGIEPPDRNTRNVDTEP